MERLKEIKRILKEVEADVIIVFPFIVYVIMCTIFTLFRVGMAGLMGLIIIFIISMSFTLLVLLATGKVKE